MARLPHPVVAQTSPNLYNAVASANLTPEETNMVTQMSFAYQEGLKLRKLPVDQAKESYRNLKDDAKKQIQALFPNDEYTKADPSLLSKGFGLATSFVGGVLKKVGSPIIGTFQAADAYGKAINTPLRVGFQTQTLDKPLFSTKTWSDAYKGVDFYNPNDVKVLEEKYGKAKAAVAMGVVAGKTPGEIIQDWGKVDAEITDALAESLDNPKDFQPIIDETKLARFSPGRSIVRQSYDEKHPTTSTIWEQMVGKEIEVPNLSPEEKAKREAYKLKVKARQAGVIDAVYQIAIDPATYATAGLSKLPLVGKRLSQFAISKGADEAGFLVAGQGNKGRALADKILKAGDTPEAVATTVREVFTRPDVRSLWDEMGPYIQKFNESEGNVAKSRVFDEFKYLYDEYNNFETFKLMAKNRVYDANSAEKFFSDVENTRYLLSGRVDGTNFYRNGVATARSSRHLTAGIARAVDSIFNPSARNTPTRDTIEKATAVADEQWKILTTLGDEADRGVNPNIANLESIDKDISKVRQRLFKIGQLAGRSPASKPIFYGDNAIKTIKDFENLAGLVVPKDMAKVLALNFLDSSEDQQVVAIRNLYAAYMQQQGLEGIPQGRRFIESILDKTFNNHSGFNTLAKTEVSQELSQVMSKHAIDWQAEAPYLKNRGATQPFQLAGAVGGLPFEEIAAVKAMVGVRDSAGRFTLRNGIPSILDGIHRSYFMRAATDIWTTLTLAVRTGVRSAIDEITFFGFTAPNRDVVDFAINRGRKEGKVLTTATGSKAAVGTYKRIINKVFRGGGLEERIDRAERVKIVEELQKSMSEKLGYEVPVETIDAWLIRQEVGNRAWDVVFKGATTKDQKYLMSLLINQPDTVESMAKAISSKTSLSGRFDEQFRDITLPDSVITKAFEESGLKLGNKFRALSTRELKQANQKYPALAHFDAFGLRFAHNDVKLGTGKSVNPVPAFFGNNGLKTVQDFMGARRSVLKQVGVNMDAIDDTLTVFDPDLLKRFVDKFGDSVYWRQKGLPDQAIARIYIESMLADMRIAFHGGKDAFNDELMNLVKEKHFDIVEAARKAGNNSPYKAWERAVAGIEFSDFEKVTVDRHPVGDINVRVDFFGEDIEAWYKQFGNFVFEQADRQVTGMFRQPAVTLAYLNFRKAYAQQEAAFATKLEREFIQANGFDTKARERALDIADKRYTEIANNEAIYTVLKYVDNPAIKSNFALSVRHVGRFYRATEDFYRRYYRMMRDKPLQVIYRMRLLHQGLQSSGSVYKDQQGNEYFIFPTDAVINGALEPTMRKLTGDNQFVIPQFDDFKMKLTMLNPSFSPDAGVPALSGPGAAVSVLGVKAILGNLPGPLALPGAKAGEFVNNLALGNIGKNMTLRRAIVPFFVENVLTLTKPAQDILGISNEENMTREEVSAAMQAASYMQVYGKNPLPENPTPQERADYMKALRISTHNVLFMRAFLGIFAPASASLQESKGVPNYYKEAGVTSLRNEFYTILEGIKKTYGTEINDPYALATAIFIAKNPKKSIYIASRTNKNTLALIGKTNEVKDWSLANESFINKYGEAAYLVAPQVGEFNSAVYNWMESQELISQPKLADYLDRVLVAEDKAAYFDIGRREQEALTTVNSITERKGIIANATAQRQALLTSNPLLVDALQSKNNFPQEKMTLDTLQVMLDDKDTPINSTTRVKLRAAVNSVQELVSMANDQEYKSLPYFADMKRDKKAEVEKIILDLKAGDLVVSEAYRAVLRPIIDFYSRDTYVPFRKVTF